jgi:hypothetical protein
MLESLGMTEEAIGAEIRATMETVEVARTAAGMPLYLDRTRPAPTASSRSTASSRTPASRDRSRAACTKMAVVGFGKQPGAAQIHSCGPIEMRDRILAGIAALRGTGRLLGGVGVDRVGRPATSCASRP